MSLKWKLSLLIAGVILLTVALETAAARTLNLKMASFAGRAWLATQQGRALLDEYVYRGLEQEARGLKAAGLTGGAAPASPALDTWAAGDRFWVLQDERGRVAGRSPGACLPHAGTALRPGRTLLSCGPVAAFTFAVTLDHPRATLVLGRKLGPAYAEEVKLASGAEVALLGPDGALGSTAPDERGGRAMPSFALDLARLPASALPAFSTRAATVPGYAGYGDERFGAGEPSFQSFSYVAPITGGDGTYRVVLWVPAESLVRGGYSSKLVTLGTLAALPLLLVFAWTISSRLTRPLRALIDVAGRVARGDLDARPPAASGEIGQLAGAFEKMLVDLKAAQERSVVSEKMAAIGQLAGGVAHEINNPLGVILGFSQGMERRLPAADPLRLPVESIVREALRCKALVQELLVFSRTGKKHVEPLDVDALVRATLPLLEARAKTQGVKVTCELGLNGAVLQANRTQLQQVLVNLGSNALDAMEQGGQLTLRTRGEGDGGGVLLEVADTGHGIPEEIRTRIFEPFFTTKEVGKGTGLGLSLVHEIVKQHKGEIRVRSSAGAGTTMQVRLP